LEHLEPVRRTIACLRILPDRVEQGMKSTFEKTCQEELLATTGVLVASGVRTHHNRAATKICSTAPRESLHLEKLAVGNGYVFFCSTLVLLTLKRGRPYEREITRHSQ